LFMLCMTTGSSGHDPEQKKKAQIRV